MTYIPPEELKRQIENFWNKQPCGSDLSQKKKFSREYFEELEIERYQREPEILSFAEFERAKGKNILEVGVGTGTDFIQWVRAGANAYGIDLSPESIRQTVIRLKTYGLEVKKLKVADAESLPYPDHFFDIVYSWGVIHHTPDTQKALEEMVRVCEPGGICKIMVYNRHSLFAFYVWLKRALFAGKPWKSFSWCLSHHLESPDTKAFTKKEMRNMIKDLPVENLAIAPGLTYYDTLGYRSKWIHRLARGIASLCGGNHVGWFLTIQFEKRKTPA